jgi:NADH-quinone oxidoreductase subunit K
MVPTNYYVILSAILFGLGVFAFVFKRNIITIFMSIELMLNAVNLAFVAFSRALGKLDGSSGRPRNHHPHRAQPTIAKRRAR